jgi:tRNA threonylcarbamoyladenosine biosynthesis protein TsaB
MGRKFALAFDTSTNYLSVALAKENKIVAESHQQLPRQHLSKLLPTINWLLNRNNCQPKDLNLIIVGQGPGSYTGLRIGLATAQGLACSVECQLIGLPTFDVIAYQLLKPDRFVCIVTDAKRDQLYWAIYPPGNQAKPDEKKYQVGSIAELISQIAKIKKPILYAGDGIDLIKRAISSETASFATKEFWYPRATNLINLTKIRGIPKNKKYYQILPIYIRLPAT